MTKSQPSSLLLPVLVGALAFALTGCMATRPQSFKLAFLPATPLPIDPVIVEPPLVNAAFFAKESPNLIERTLATPVRPPEIESRIVRVDDHFEAGKKLYQQGDFVGARQEFDRAIDVVLSTPDNFPDRQRLERKMDQMVESIYRYDLAGLGAGSTQQEIVYDKSPLDSIVEMTFPTDPNLRPKVKEELEATVSQLPLEESDAVLGYIQYFSSTRGHRSLVAGLRRAGRYRPLIQRILDEEGVPQELIYLAQIESGFLPRARSNKKAVGMWQFVQFRGREYGLNQSPATDDRMDPEKATRAAAKHLHDLYAMFGDWYLAMAAYNCGPGCVDRAVQKTGYADYWELRRLNVLPKDTNNYVPVILALTIMAKNPKDYDLENLDLDPPVEYDTIDLETPTNLSLIADSTDRPVPEIQELNPSLTKLVAPAGYQLRVPKGSSSTVRMALDAVPPEHRTNWRIHKVAPGETLADIAHRFATPAASIAAVNHRVADQPEVGETLLIPAGYAAPRASARPAASLAHRQLSHPSASRKASTTAPVHRAATTPYKTASLTPKHRTTVN